MRQFSINDTSPWLEHFGSGKDGAYTPTTSTDSPVNTTFLGTSGSQAFTVGSATGFSDGDLCLIHQSRGTGAGNWELNRISSISGLTLVYPLQNTYVTGAQVILLKQYSSATISSGVTITTKKWDESTGGIFALLCNGNTQIDGTIFATAKGYHGGAPGSDATDYGAYGEGTNGPRVANVGTGANGNGGGAGLQALEGGNGGGGGGNGTAGANGETQSANPGPGIGGNASGNANLTVMTFGGGGGTGGRANNNHGGGGGDGGGCVFIFSRTISGSGSIVTNGGIVGEDTTGGVGTSGAEGSGGGGAGGPILLKGISVSFAGTLTATGAPAYTPGSTGKKGGTGGDGRIHVDYLATVSAIGTPTITSSVDGGLNDMQGAVLSAFL